MAHRARVLHGERTIRFHYANCATFNADFDGDEINLHLPQEHQGRAEGYQIVHADHQFKVPTDGKPVRGLIQDHVIAALQLTKRDTFLLRGDFLHLCSIACSGTERSADGGAAARGAWDPPCVRVLLEQPVPLPLPAVLKPVPMWTGKQVLNTLIAFHTAGMPAATFQAKAKVTELEWGADTVGTECLVNMRQGYLCHGTFDKAQYGSRGLLHTFQVCTVLLAVCSVLEKVRSF
jgi:DNA-directed RNA polymerase I subunit RPA1